MIESVLQFDSPASYLAVGVGTAALALVLLVVVAGIRISSQWLHAKKLYSPIGLVDILRLRFHRCPVRAVIDGLHQLHQAGEKDITVRQLIHHHLAGGSIERIIDAMMISHVRKLAVNWDTICAYDLSGEDPVEKINLATQPWIIEVPSRQQLNGQPLSPVAQDGVELLIRGEATVRARPDLHMGQTPQVLIALVAERIMRTVRTWESHESLLAKPDILTNAVLMNRDQYHRAGLELIDFRFTQFEAGRQAMSRPPKNIRMADILDDANRSGIWRPPLSASVRERKVRQAIRKQQHDSLPHADVVTLLAGRNPQSLATDELLRLAQAYELADDYKSMRATCELALHKEPSHLDANLLMRQAMLHSDAPLAERLAFINRCLNLQIEPCGMWHLLKAAILCEAAVRFDAEADRIYIANPEKYEQALDALHKAHEQAGDLAALNEAYDLFDDWSVAFPLMCEDHRFKECTLSQTPDACAWVSA